MKRSSLAIIVIVSVLLIDQALKLWVKTNMYIGQDFDIFGDWFKIHFIENEGMAFGLKLGGSYGKLLLSSFRIVAVCFMFYILRTLILAKESKILIGSIALITAGAIGNIIDSSFYGLIFSESNYYTKNIAQFSPENGGYAGFLHGKVVDMFYFPLYQNYLPDWIPYFGGKFVTFFRPVFNVADSAITIGVAIILLFQREFLFHQKQKETDEIEIKSNPSYADTDQQ